MSISAGLCRQAGGCQQTAAAEFLIFAVRALAGNAKMAERKIVFYRVFRAEAGEAGRNLFGGFPVVAATACQFKIAGDPADMAVEWNQQQGRGYLRPQVHIDTVFRSHQSAQEHVPALDTAACRRVGQKMPGAARERAGNRFGFEAESFM